MGMPGPPGRDGRGPKGMPGSPGLGMFVQLFCLKIDFNIELHGIGGQVSYLYSIQFNLRNCLKRK